MNIAVSGTHSSGKTTLVEELSAALPGHEVFDEPYYLLEAEGYQFAAPPSVEDLEAQLMRSIESMAQGPRNSIFERCPLDFLTYLLATRNAEAARLEAWVSKSRPALARLDLIVHVPIEDPDLIPVSGYPRLRQRVAEHLRRILEDDPWAFGLPVLQVSGTARERSRQVLAHPAVRHGVPQDETSSPPPA